MTGSMDWFSGLSHAEQLRVKERFHETRGGEGSSRDNASVNTRRVSVVVTQQLVAEERWLLLAATPTRSAA